MINVKSHLLTHDVKDNLVAVSKAVLKLKPIPMKKYFRGEESHTQFILLLISMSRHSLWAVPHSSEMICVRVRAQLLLSFSPSLCANLLLAQYGKRKKKC